MQFSIDGSILEAPSGGDAEARASSSASGKTLHWSFAPATNFGSFAAHWDELNERFVASPLLMTRFVSLGLRHFGNGSELIAIATDEAGLAVMTLLAPSGRLRWRVFQPSQLPLSLWSMRPDISLAEAACSLVRRAPRLIPKLSITHLDPQFVPRPLHARCLGIVDHIVTGQILLPDSFERYLSGRPAATLKQLCRRLRKAEAEIGPISLRVETTPDAAERYVGEYADVESAGWKGQLGSALRRGGVQERFYRELMQSFCSTGEGRMYTLVFGDRAAAMEFGVVKDGVLYLLKTTYDESLRCFGPGVALTRFIIESLYERDEGIRRIEFYGALDDSQRAWVSGSRALYHVNAYRWRMARRLHEAIRARSGKA